MDGAFRQGALTVSGCYRRRIDLSRPDERTAIGWLEDDYHHFGVTIAHEGATVRAVRAASPRHPWTTCPGALQAIEALVGQPLVRRCSDVGRLIDMRSQCTHLFDLAGLVLAQAAQGRPPRRYEVVIPDRAVIAGDETGGFARAFGPTTARLSKDGIEVMAWDIDGDRIIAPATAAGRSLQRGFREWTEVMPEGEAEHATILRRSIMVGSGRVGGMDGVASADELTTMGAVCFTFQPERRGAARFIAGSRLDFSDRPEALLAHPRPVPSPAPG